MRLIFSDVDQGDNQEAHVVVPHGWIAAINLPDGISPETAFRNRGEWADFLFIGPMRVIGNNLTTAVMMSLDDLPELEG